MSSPSFQRFENNDFVFTDVPTYKVGDIIAVVCFSIGCLRYWSPMEMWEQVCEEMEIAKEEKIKMTNV